MADFLVFLSDDSLSMIASIFMVLLANASLLLTVQRKGEYSVEKLGWFKPKFMWFIAIHTIVLLLVLILILRWNP
uniref:Uncharacterized protein n=1 Tax=Candidatus Kentrum sp. LFY TaxID=2126342 RepID=A0A450UKH5_9GAMM|nr:MAG: hypothetical protein BECKLFY1418B_GA0070995_10418 [Candidatus Kentron sp. LFY]